MGRRPRDGREQRAQWPLHLSPAPHELHTGPAGGWLSWVFRTNRDDHTRIPHGRQLRPDQAPTGNVECTPTMPGTALGPGELPGSQETPNHPVLTQLITRHPDTAQRRREALAHRTPHRPTAVLTVGPAVPPEQSSSTSAPGTSGGRALGRGHQCVLAALPGVSGTPGGKCLGMADESWEPNLPAAAPDAGSAPAQDFVHLGEIGNPREIQVLPSRKTNEGEERVCIGLLSASGVVKWSLK